MDPLAASETDRPADDSVLSWSPGSLIQAQCDQNLLLDCVVFKGVYVVRRAAEVQCSSPRGHA